MIINIDLAFPSIPDAYDRESILVGIKSQRAVSYPHASKLMLMNFPGTQVTCGGFHRPLDLPEHFWPSEGVSAPLNKTYTGWTQVLSFSVDAQQIPSACCTTGRLHSCVQMNELAHVHTSKGNNFYFTVVVIYFVLPCPWRPQTPTAQKATLTVISTSDQERTKGNGQ